LQQITNKQEALDAVNIDGMRLDECSDNLRNDKDVAIAAVKNREKAMMFVSEKLKSDKDVIRSALVRKSTLRSEEGIAFSFLPDKIKDNEIIVLMSIPMFGGAFQYISDRLKKDEDFIVEAALVNIEILRHVDSKFLKDENFIQKILDNLKRYLLSNKKDIAKFFHVTILDNENMIKEIIKKAGYENFKYASARLKESRDYALEIIPIAPKAYELLDSRFRDDKEVTISAVRKDGMNLRLASWRLREDKEIVLEAVKNNPHSLQFADDILQDDEELLSYVTKDDSYYYNMLDTRNGLRYDIPMLMTTDPVYYFKYIRYMKLKEQSLDTFEKMLRWD